MASDIEAMTVPPGRAGLAASALMLARQLDVGAGLATAAVARELRATMEAMGRSDGTVDGELADLLAELSAPIQYPAASG